MGTAFLIKTYRTRVASIGGRGRLDTHYPVASIKPPSVRCTLPGPRTILRNSYSRTVRARARLNARSGTSLKIVEYFSWLAGLPRALLLSLFLSPVVVYVRRQNGGSARARVHWPPVRFCDASVYARHGTKRERVWSREKEEGLRRGEERQQEREREREKAEEKRDEGYARGKKEARENSARIILPRYNRRSVDGT